MHETRQHSIPAEDYALASLTEAQLPIARGPSYRAGAAPAHAPRMDVASLGLEVMPSPRVHALTAMQLRCTQGQMHLAADKEVEDGEGESSCVRMNRRGDGVFSQE